MVLALQAGCHHSRDASKKKYQEMTLRTKSDRYAQVRSNIFYFALFAASVLTLALAGCGLASFAGGDSDAAIEPPSEPVNACALTPISAPLEWTAVPELLAGRLSNHCAEALMASDGDALQQTLVSLLENEFHTLNTDDAVKVLESFGKNIPVRYLAYMGRFAQRPEYPLDREELTDYLEAALTDDPLSAGYFAYTLAGMDVRSRANQDLERATRICLDLAETEELKRLRAYCVNILSVAAFQRGELGESVRLFEEAIAAFLEIPDPVAAATPIYNIGSIFDDLGDLERARTYFNEAGDIYLAQLEINPESSVHLNDIGYVWRAVGGIELQLDEFEKAIELFDKSIAAQAKAKTNTLLARNLELKSRALSGLGQKEEALRLAHQSLNALSDDQNLQKAEVTLWLATIEADLGRPQIAEDHLLSIKSLIGLGDQIDADQISGLSDRDFAADYAAAMAENLRMLGRTGEALDYASVGLELGKRLIDQQDLSLLANTEVLFRLRSREGEMRANRQRTVIAEQESAIARLQSNRWQMQAIIAILCAFGAFLVAFFYARGFRAQRQLARMQKLIATESQHRSQNNLQMISSLLRLNGRQGPGTNTEEEMSSRVQAMALAQQFLTHPDASSTGRIDLSKYLGELLALIESGIGRSNVTIECKIDAVETAIEQAVPLALIVNESVTNSYKYAFGTEGGIINVSLSVSKTEGYTLTVRDQPSIAPVETPGQPYKSGFGHGLIQSFAEQLDATASFEITPRGAIWIIDGLSL